MTLVNLKLDDKLHRFVWDKDCTYSSNFFLAGVIAGLSPPPPPLSAFIGACFNTLILTKIH